MQLITVNLKQFEPTVEQAIATMEIEIEIAKKSDVKIIKFIHGYGSHGVGGAISVAVREHCRKLKKQKIIKDYFSGGRWDIADEKCFPYLMEISNLYGDEDLGNSNPGITIVVL